MSISPPRALSRTVGLCLLAFEWLLIGTPVFAGSPDRSNAYLYEDNKRLVGLVEDAAALIESRGTEAFAAFAVKGSRWLNRERYLFVYDDRGTGVFHPVEPELGGQNLSGFTDIDHPDIFAGVQSLF